MAEIERVMRKLRHLRRVEASYRADIRRALEQSKAETVDPVRARERYERLRLKYERRIERIVPKIRALTDRRERLKRGHAGKG
jgi:hypothetical protein